jgi:hypothetical protein
MGLTIVKAFASPTRCMADVAESENEIQEATQALSSAEAEDANVDNGEPTAESAEALGWVPGYGYGYGYPYYPPTYAYGGWYPGTGYIRPGIGYVHPGFGYLPRGYAGLTPGFGFWNPAYAYWRPYYGYWNPAIRGWAGWGW